MTDGPVLSVRAQSVRIVAPDVVSLPGALETKADRKADAIAEAGRLQRDLLTALESMGGVPAPAGDHRVPLCWVTRSVTSQPEQEFVPAKQTMEPTGRVVARVALELRIRDFALLDRLDAVLAGIDAYQSFGASWGVDPDNPEWRAVRADAIHDALRQADDYAAALGCRVARVEQVADAGLLADAAPVAAAALPGRFMAMSGRAMESGPSLDPEPQQLWATIDVRCTTEKLPA
jgi:uncharacterized protein YggE